MELADLCDGDCVTFQGMDHQLNEWHRCLEACLSLLQSAVEIFNNVSSSEVMDEVVGSTEGKDYLHSKTHCFIKYASFKFILKYVFFLF